jgi:antitoxin PrlF
MQIKAKITSKGQITIPRKIRLALGVKEGDKLIFEENASGFTISPIKEKSLFAKYRGIGNPGIQKGRAAIIQKIRGMRETPESDE